MSLHSISFFLHWENQKDRLPYRLSGEGFLAACWLRFRSDVPGTDTGAHTSSGETGQAYRQPTPRKPLSQTPHSFDTNFKKYSQMSTLFQSLCWGPMLNSEQDSPRLLDASSLGRKK